MLHFLVLLFIKKWESAISVIEGTRAISLQCGILNLMRCGLSMENTICYRDWGRVIR